MLLAPPPLVLAINPNTRLVTEKNKFFFVWRTTYLHDLILLILLLFLLCIKSTRHEHVSSHMLYRAITHSLCWGISTWLVVYGQVSATHFLLWTITGAFFYVSLLCFCNFTIFMWKCFVYITDKIVSHQLPKIWYQSSPTQEVTAEEFIRTNGKMSFTTSQKVSCFSFYSLPLLAMFVLLGELLFCWVTLVTQQN